MRSSVLWALRLAAQTLPVLHSPKSSKYQTAGDVQRHRKNRKFFKRVSALSKATLWQALSETDNSPEPFTTDSKGRASNVGGGAPTLISADAVEAAERDFKVGVKRLVILSLENPLFQKRLRLAHTPPALTVPGYICGRSS